MKCHMCLLAHMQYLQHVHCSFDKPPLHVDVITVERLLMDISLLWTVHLVPERPKSV